MTTPYPIRCNSVIHTRALNTKLFALLSKQPATKGGDFTRAQQPI
jgi:hypothetical protein